MNFDKDTGKKEEERSREEISKNLYDKFPAFKIWVDGWNKFISDFYVLQNKEKNGQLKWDEKDDYLKKKEIYSKSIKYLDFLQELSEKYELSEADKESAKVMREGSYHLLYLILSRVQGRELAKALTLFDRLS